MFDRSNISGVRRTLAVAVALLPALQPLTPRSPVRTSRPNACSAASPARRRAPRCWRRCRRDISASNAHRLRRSSRCRIRSFYNVTLRNFAAPMTNKAQSVFVPLNDYTATIIGMIRDNVPFNTVLSADLIYIGNVSAARRPTRRPTTITTSIWIPTASICRRCW